ncbi:amine oxidase [Thecamonas trahens ATCC 50062]|uniref:Amine oxidase n=1 Tax=Thecamonas trahens ATCC 50062 TaxID=461836 RepID=A0A0L0DKW6_THETB|nr:amine oxidase [Thecamonas trahens ATCC 50062]KNC52003.1 amine oxidase [Thecamonas trahens ATCC 50062]|eukprot:XP_013755587.1 amine oxidase [Thecamonas trahens ATCC 50062]
MFSGFFWPLILRTVAGAQTVYGLVLAADVGNLALVAGTLTGLTAMAVFVAAAWGLSKPSIVAAWRAKVAHGAGGSVDGERGMRSDRLDVLGVEQVYVDADPVPLETFGAAGRAERIAGGTVMVVGGGVSGLGAAWALEQDGWQVTLIEAEAELGGHTTTLRGEDLGLPADPVTGAVPTVDPGFQICNPLHYPGLLAWFRKLGKYVALRPTENSLSVSSHVDGYGWASCASWLGLVKCLALRGRKFAAMMRDMVRFHAEAEGYLTALPDMTLREFVAREGYSDAFAADYLMPCVASLWSCSAEGAWACSIHFIIRFFRNHHMLNIFSRPVWHTLIGGSSTYVDAFKASFRGTIVTSAPAARLVHAPNGGEAWRVTTADGRSFDASAVVLATHSSTTLRLLQASSAAVTSGLGTRRASALLATLNELPYYSSKVYVHTDASLMPAARELWASWNSVVLSTGESICTYYVNKLQAPDYTGTDIFVTVVPEGTSAAALPSDLSLLRKLPFDWEHPSMSVGAVAARCCDASLQHPGDGLVLAGAWLGNGFHEAGFQSGLRAAAALGDARL